MEEIKIGDKKYELLIKELGNLPLIIVKAKNGYVACNYIDKKTADKLGDVAAFVSGVKSLDQFLKSKIRDVTTWAEDVGLREGITVKKALEILDQDEPK